MFILLSLFILFSAILYFLGVKTKNRKLIYLHKPLTMLFIISLAISGSLASWSSSAIWIVTGLVFSVIGDIFLMLPRDRFVYGLSAFALAHGSYIVSFVPFSSLSDINFLPIVCILIIAVLFFSALYKGVMASGGIKLLTPVIFYILLISMMVWVALLTASPWLVTAALLFYLSDAALAWDRFIKPLPFRSYLVMSTYFAAQYLYACSVHFH